MSLLSYIFSTILLSWMGVGAYLLLRQLRPSFLARRSILWLILCASLLLPLTPPFTQTNYRHIQAQTGKEITQSATVINPMPVGATNVQDFCHCSQPHAGDVILYQTSRIYDFLLRHQLAIQAILTGFGFLLMLRIFVQLGRLLWRTRSHAAEWIKIEGILIRIVRDIPGLSAASLHCWGKFIFWSEVLDNMQTEDRNAVLLHEFSHIQQRNSSEKIFLAVLQLIWWINPVFYFISKELEQLSEYVADQYAVFHVGTPKQYAGLLLRMKTGEAFAPLQFFNGSSLKRRVEIVLQTKNKPKMNLALALVIWVVLVLPGELLAKRIVREQLQDIEVYEFLTECNQETGQLQFCRKCTYEVWESCYREEQIVCDSIQSRLLQTPR